jgi:hypothetical protein
MNTQKYINGSCLCEAVTIEVAPDKKIFDACHCGMCRKWGGGPVFTIESSIDAKLSGEEFITVYDSSDWAERAFCKRCGTHLFYRLKNSKMWNFCAGLFKETEHFKFHLQIFTDFKPANYDFANKTEMMTEAEVMAKYAGK